MYLGRKNIHDNTSLRFNTIRRSSESHSIYIKFTLHSHYFHISFTFHSHYFHITFTYLSHYIPIPHYERHVVHTIHVSYRCRPGQCCLYTRVLQMSPCPVLSVSLENTKRVIKHKATCIN